tara:strand:- start:2734 stop:3771 length:1038 start_codon:yes stop_codon:yes gene_type:complete
MNRIIDLRSDTMTKPSPDMRRAIANADVGDDVWGEDPTVNKLEAYAATMLGKPAALFVPSGTMANQIAIRSLTNPGDEIIIETNAHIVQYESGAASALSGIQPCTLSAPRGIMTAEQVESAIKSPDIHNPLTSLICLENTHNRAGGTVYPLKTISQIRNIATARNIAMHLDGARLFNAVCATGVAPNIYASHFETVSFCLSKGLGAPVGSMLVSSKARIAQMRRIRKMYGGGMRQAGIIAAAGLYALKHNIVRLHDDHKHAQLLAQGLEKVPGIMIDAKKIETNIIIFDVGQFHQSQDNLFNALKREGLLLSRFTPTSFRAVTHLGITHQDIVDAIEIINNTFLQ